MNLVRKIAENYKLPYYTMSPTYSVCKDHGYLTGEQFTCPICGRKTEVYSRITGYYRPVQNWNDGKAQEYKDRMVYNIGRSHLTHIGPNPAPNDNTEAIYAAINERGCCDPMQPIMKGDLADAEPKAAPAAETVAEAVKAPVEAAKTVAEAVKAPVEAVKAAAETAVKFAVKPEGSMSILLFKTPSCPNCKAAGAILDKAGVEYEPLNANEERELVKKFGIKQAPTLVLVNGDSFEKYRGVSDIKGWLMHK